ncbi:MAG: hypothetical protein IPF53_12835 [Blastocatellia bacterium]|nr:hypothetical protein [Blastocatellia bacterium]
MKFAQRVYQIAGLYGLVALLPMYFMEDKTGRDFPPAITHPEYYYGFIGVAVAWQVAFLIMSRDPVRYRLLMIPAVIEKFSFGIAVIVLFGFGRVNELMLAAAVVDLVLGTLFAVAYVKTRDTGEELP